MAFITTGKIKSNSFDAQETISELTRILKKKTGCLPLGSVVSLIGGKKRLTIIGRIQISSKTNDQFDYAGVLFTEGDQQADQLYLFNNSDIEHVSQMGMIDKKKLVFQNFLVKKIELYKSQSIHH